MKRINRKIIFTLVYLFLMSGFLFSDNNWVVYPFYNKSNFHPSYDFGKEVSKLFIIQLKKSTGISAQLLTGEEFHPEQSAKYLVKGTINKFSLESYGVIFPGRAGYVHYRSVIDMTITVITNSKYNFNFGGTMTKESDKLGLTLMGGPGTTAEVESTVYAELQKYPVDSKIFKESLPGCTLAAGLEDICSRMKKKLELNEYSAQDNSGKFFEIVSLEKDGVYINGGSANLIRSGDNFNVFRTGKQIKDPNSGAVLGNQETLIGKIQVMMVLSEFLSKARILEEKQKFMIKDRIR